MGETGDLGALTPGRVLGGRFEIHGVVGRGGTATVLLATDRLRGERVALKIVHPHLAADPAAQRRLRREVQTASVLRSDAALVPNDLHEIDGMIALSMPFHPGQTLSERVATRGPLPPDQVRALGIRIAAALASAHRAGVLHRDVTPNNVLLADNPSEAVLTDFGLARLTLGQTRSTGLLGTAGYAAPEIYEGNRSDPRSDLYGLGAVLYLAATGKPPFDTRSPMAALKQQLDGRSVKLSSQAPAVPADLAFAIERLLSPEPSARFATALDVVDALSGKVELTSTRSLEPRPVQSAKVSGRFLPEGRYTVIITERSEDRERRERLRRTQPAPRGLPDEIARIGWHLADRVRDALGVPPAPVLTPEEQLMAALASEMQVPTEMLAPSPALKRRKFRLVDATDQDTAEQLAIAARTAGFRASVVAIAAPSDVSSRWWYLYFAIMAVGWSTLPFEMRIFGNSILWVLIAISAGGPMLLQALGAEPLGERRQTEKLPVAYRADLVDGVVAGASPAPRFLSKPAIEAAQAESAPKPADDPGARAASALDRLDEVLQQVDLPEVARRDLAESSRALRIRAKTLSIEVARLKIELSADSGAEEQLPVLSARLARLETLARAGEVASRDERERIVKAIERHEESQRSAERVESEWVASSAELFEIASTADQIRRDLLVQREHPSTDEWVERMTRTAKAATDAQRETQQKTQQDAARQARRQRE